MKKNNQKKIDLKKAFKEDIIEEEKKFESSQVYIEEEKKLDEKSVVFIEKKMDEEY